jgi:RNase P subunit RPR2
MTIGKCPHCENLLDDDDIAEIKFRGALHTHHAYVCRRCDTIIGFSSARP